MTTFNKLTVGGVEFSKEKGISLVRSISTNNATSRVNVVLDNFGGKNKDLFTEGAELVIFADQDVNPPTTKLFTGIITNVKFNGKGTNNERITVMARDYGNLLQKRTIEPEVYTNQELSFIVNDLMTKYGPADVTTTNVNVTGKSLARISFKQDNIFDALIQLAQFVDFIVYVDEDKDLHFEEKGSTSSGITLDNTNVVKSNITNDIGDVKNEVFVYGARQFVASPTETFTAGSPVGGSLFTLENQPFNTDVQVSGVDQVGGIFKQNEAPESGLQYLVNVFDQQIIFISGTELGYSSIPASGDSVVVDYDVSRPIIKVADDKPSIASFKKRNAVIINESISDPDTAKDVAKSFITLNKDVKIQANLSVQSIVNLVPSQTALVNLPNENISNQTFQIIQARYEFNTKNNQADRVLTVKLSERVADVTDVLKDLVLAVKRLEAGQIDSTGIISRLIVSTGSYGFKVNEWNVKTRSIENAFVLGHALNGVLGSPATGVGSGQVVLGSDGVGAFAIQRSGGDL